MSKLACKLTRHGKNGPLWLSVRDMGANKINRSTTLLFSTVFAIVLIIFFAITSVSAFFESYSDNYPYDIIVKNATKVASEYGFVKEIDGVYDIVYEYWDITETTVDGTDFSRNAVLVSADGYSNGITFKNPEITCPEEGFVIIDSLLASELNLKEGDSISFEFYDPELVRKHPTFTIAGFCDSTVFYSKRTAIIMNPEDYRTTVTERPKIIGISVNGDIDRVIDDFNRAVARKYGEQYSVARKDAFVGNDVDMAISALKSVSAVPVLVVLLACFGLVNNQLISFNQKKTHFAVLHSTAMSMKQLQLLMGLEMFFSCLTGLVTGSATALWLMKVFRDIIFVSIGYMKISITIPQILASVGLLFILLAITMVFPLRSLKKMNVVKEIRYE